MQVAVARICTCDGFKAVANDMVGEGHLQERVQQRAAGLKALQERLQRPQLRPGHRCG